MAAERDKSRVERIIELQREFERLQGQDPEIRELVEECRRMSELTQECRRMRETMDRVQEMQDYLDRSRAAMGLPKGRFVEEYRAQSPYVAR
jgi:hypothetical protein